MAAMSFSTLRILTVAIAVLTSMCISIDAEDDLNTIAGNLRTLLEVQFSENRNHHVNPTNKDNAINYIAETMKSYNLDVRSVEFAGQNVRIRIIYKGVNIIGILPGKTKGTADDQVILLGSHFDTVKTTPGVDDNGSGIAALLEAARLVTSETCVTTNTIVFVAFDLEESQEEVRKGLIGSQHFVNDWLIDFLVNSDGTNSSFKGAIVLETLMNFDSGENAQTFPPGFKDGFKDLYNKISSRNFTGDFITVIGRQTNDAALMSGFTNHWSGVGDDMFLNESIPLPFSGVPTDQDFLFYGDFFRSDHTRFWQHPPNSLSAILLTDTANFRGDMRQCYHNPCDNVTSITDDKMKFLAKTTRSVANMLIEQGIDNLEEVCADANGLSYSSTHLAVIGLMITLSLLM
ncbi:uncharacterized protein YfbL-like [Glandiceps talaboti]